MNCAGFKIFKSNLSPKKHKKTAPNGAAKKWSFGIFCGLAAYSSALSTL
jgi:hypothetical protein